MPSTLAFAPRQSDLDEDYFGLPACITMGRYEAPTRPEPGPGAQAMPTAPHPANRPQAVAAR